MIKTRHYTVIAAVILMLGALGFAQTDSGDLPTDLSALRRLVPERGLVTFVEGGVEVRRPDADWEPLYTGDTVHPDDRIRSGADGRAEVSWGNPKRVIRVERESVVALSGEAVGNRLVLVGASVERGVLWAQVAGKRTFAVSSPSMNGLLRQGKLALRVDQDGERVAVYQGPVTVDGERLQSGQGVLRADGRVSMFEVSADDDLRDGWRDIVKEALVAGQAEAVGAPETKRLTRDLRDLNPDIYLGVEVELTGTETDEAEGFEADAARIRKIRVRASKWDGMQPDSKVRLLNDTFAVLKARYPGILETVVLEFDDDRPRLALKYAGTS